MVQGENFTSVSMLWTSALLQASFYYWQTIPCIQRSPTDTQRVLSQKGQEASKQVALGEVGQVGWE